MAVWGAQSLPVHAATPGEEGGELTATLAGLLMLAALVMAAMWMRIRLDARRLANVTGMTCALGGPSPEKLLHLMHGDLPVFITYVDRDFRYRYVNAEVARWFGGEADAYLGKTVREVVGERAFAELKPRMERALAGETVDFEQEVEYLHGGLRTIRVRYLPDVQSGGQVAGYYSVVTDISQERETNHLLAESRLWLQTLLDTLPVSAYVKDSQVRFLMVNPVFCRRMGRTPEELIGKTAREVSIASGTQVEQTIREDREVLEQGHVVEVLRNPLKLKDGGEIWRHTIKAPLRSAEGAVVGMLGLQINITPHMEAERALKESQERLRQTMANIPSAIFLKDLEGNYTLVNRHFEEWFGFRNEDVIGKNSYDFFPREAAARYMAQDREVLECGEAKSKEIEVTTRDGVLRTMIDTKFPLRNAEGEVLGSGTILTDISEQRTMEENLRQAQKMEGIGQLAGGIAHDFNNLMQIILGYTIISMDEDIPPMVRDNLAQVRKAGDQAAELTKRLLAFSRKQTLQFAPVELTSLVRDQIGLLERVLGGQITMRFESSMDAAWVQGDASSLVQALMNLCINARDAMADGGEITLRVEPATRPNAMPRNPGDPEGMVTLLEVRDNGKGMTADVLERAYEPFFTTKGVGEGSGLGLSMVYGLIQQHQGHIDIESTPNAGTTVRIWLPPVDPPGLRKRQSNQAIVDGSPGGHTILVVEDTSQVLDLTSKLLESKGYKVLRAGNGVEALEMLHSHDGGIDLALMDVMMPQMGGEELGGRIAQDFPQMPMVFATGHAQMRVDHGLLNGQRVRLIKKPYTPDTLFSTLRELLGG